MNRFERCVHALSQPSPVGHVHWHLQIHGHVHVKFTLQSHSHVHFSVTQFTLTTTLACTFTTMITSMCTTAAGFTYAPVLVFATTTMPPHLQLHRLLQCPGGLLMQRRQPDTEPCKGRAGSELPRASHSNVMCFPFLGHHVKES